MQEYRNDKGDFHRLDGPAAEYDSGNKYWYQDGKCHRLDGPAIEFASGDKYWYIEGVEYTEHEFLAKIKGGGIMQEYTNDKGELHRIDGPAIEGVNGIKWWYQNGKLHRLDGPAIEFANGNKSWYIEGKELTEKEFKAKTQAPRKVTMQEVVEQFGENVVIAKGGGIMQENKVKVDGYGTIRWYQDDKLHRIDGPACEFADGTKEWYQNDKRHRLDGPAIEWVNGNKAWYIEGVYYTEQEFKARTQTPRKVTMQEVIDRFGENVVITKEST